MYHFARLLILFTYKAIAWNWQLSMNLRSYTWKLNSAVATFPFLKQSCKFLRYRSLCCNGSYTAHYLSRLMTFPFLLFCFVFFSTSTPSAKRAEQKNKIIFRHWLAYLPKSLGWGHFLWSADFIPGSCSNLTGLLYGVDCTAISQQVWTMSDASVTTNQT